MTPNPISPTENANAWIAFELGRLAARIDHAEAERSRLRERMDRLDQQIRELRKASS